MAKNSSLVLSRHRNISPPNIFLNFTTSHNNTTKMRERNEKKLTNGVEKLNLICFHMDLDFSFQFHLKGEYFITFMIIFFGEQNCCALMRISLEDIRLHLTIERKKEIFVGGEVERMKNEVAGFGFALIYCCSYRENEFYFACDKFLLICDEKLKRTGRRKFSWRNFIFFLTQNLFLNNFPSSQLSSQIYSPSFPFQAILKSISE